MKKLIIAIGILIFMGTAFMLSSCSGSRDDGTIENGLGYFSSRQEILNRIETYASMYNKQNWYSQLRGDTVVNDIAAPESSGTDGGGSKDYTGTNTQVEGIDEGDIIKADGDHIYILNQSGFYIIKVSNGTLTKLASVQLENYVPSELYVLDNKLITIGGTYSASYDMPAVIGISSCCWYPSTSRTDIRVYDITDASAPVQERQITLSGSYNTSRLIDNTLYYVVNYYFNYGNESSYIPTISDSADGGQEKEISPQDINFFDSIPNYNYMITGKISLSDTSSASLKAYLGAGGEIYVSADNIYVSSYDYNDRWSYKRGTASYDYTQKDYTRIIKISLQDLSYKGKARLEGTIKDRYSLDEYDGYLRVATTTTYYTSNTFSSYSNVFVLDGGLKTVASISNIAPGERIYSVRFKGTEGSLVTFRQVDPLYKLNLTDPLNPTISDGLKKDGVSMYLHYIDGTDYMIGLGLDTKENEWGGATFKGIEVVLFDNSGSEAEVINTIYIGNGSSYAEALYNPKAILYDKNLNIFAFAAQAWDYSQQNNYYPVTQGYYVFGIEDGRLVQRAMLTNLTGSISYDNWYDYYNYSYSYIKRAARIGGYIYTISDRQVKGYSLEDFQPTNTLTLASFTLTENGLEIDPIG